MLALPGQARGRDEGATTVAGLTGQPSDDVAALAAEIDAEKAKASDACGKLEWLGLERETADTFEAARALDRHEDEDIWDTEKALIDVVDDQIAHARSLAPWRSCA